MSIEPRDLHASSVPPAAGLGRLVRILLVEDSEGDVALTRAALSRARVSNDLHRVADGVEALQYLRREAPFTDEATPDLVLLDLNMPRMDGREVLMHMKEDPVLRRIPVVVLTTSASERDVLASYDRSVAGYITKPVAFNDFVKVIQSLEEFWLSIVHYPPHGMN